MPDAALPITTVADPHEAGRLVATRILDRVDAAGDRPFVLGCPAGRTPTTTYAALGPLARERGTSLAQVVVVSIDEFLRPGADGPELCDPDAHYSCRRYLRTHLLEPTSAALPPELDLAPGNVRRVDPTDPGAFDAWLAGLGGIDLYLLASGASDGHVAFNPPGSALDSPTRIVELADTTRSDNLRTFPDFAGLHEVPTHGASIGLRSIAASHEVVLLLLGAEKAATLRRIVEADGFDPEWPATVLHACAEPWIVADRAAAAIG